uniref:Uncharacterized protein n=1 Tax=Cucumis melo TaxID=3656 RepID=A0A9I9CY36_CUCME
MADEPAQMEEAAAACERRRTCADGTECATTACERPRATSDGEHEQPRNDTQTEEAAATCERR